MPKNEDLTVKDLTVFQTKCNQWMKRTFLKSSLAHSPYKTTVSPTSWSDCEWESDRLKIYLESEYQDFICYIRLTCSRPKYILTRVSFWVFFLAMKKCFVIIHVQSVLWRMEHQLRNQNLWGKLKLINVQFNALELIEF